MGGRTIISCLPTMPSRSWIGSRVTGLGTSTLMWNASTPSSDLTRCTTSRSVVSFGLIHALFSLNLKGRETEIVPFFTLLIPATVRDRQGQEPNSSSKSPTWMAGTHTQGVLLRLCFGRKQRSHISTQALLVTGIPNSASSPYQTPALNH